MEGFLFFSILLYYSSGFHVSQTNFCSFPFLPFLFILHIFLVFLSQVEARRRISPPCGSLPPKYEDDEKEEGRGEKKQETTQTHNKLDFAN